MKKPAMFQAIVCKYLPMTAKRNPIIKATAQAGSMLVQYDSNLSLQQNCIDAAETYATKMQWTGNWFGGSLPDGSYAFFNSERLVKDDSAAFHIA